MAVGDDRWVIAPSWSRRCEHHRARLTVDGAACRQRWTAITDAAIRESEDALGFIERPAIAARNANNGVVVGPFGGDRRLEASLRQRGRPATADVSDAKPTHGLHAAGAHTAGGQNPTATWRLRLQVKPDGETPFAANLTEAIPLGEEISVGQRMAVLFDPNDHSRVAIDHGSHGGSTDVEDGRSSDAAHEASPPEPTALTGRRKSSGGGEPSDVPRGMLAHPSAGGPKLTDVSRSTVDRAAGTAPAERIAALADLRDRGALTAAEFEHQKQQILDG